MTSRSAGARLEGDLLRRARAGEVAGELYELVLQPAALLDLAEQHGIVEEAGHELHDAGEELHVAAPVALGVVVEVHESDERAAGHQRHGERAGVAPLAILLDLFRRKPGVARLSITSGVWSISVLSREGYLAVSRMVS